MKKKSGFSVLAFLFIVIGIILTLENFSILKGISRHWPLLIFLLGAGFIILFFERKKDDPVLVWIGVFLALLSIFFYYLNYTSWELLAYLWPLFLGIMGLSFFAVSISTKKRIFRYLSVSFLTLFLALFLVFSVSLRLWPMSLVVFGLSLLVIDYHNRKEANMKKNIKTKIRTNIKPSIKTKKSLK